MEGMVSHVAGNVPRRGLGAWGWLPRGLLVS